MKKTTFIIFASIFLIFFEQTSLSQSKELTIVYTANSNGKLMYCNCPGDPYGGLSERVTLIRKLRKKEKPFLLVDSGNMVGLFGDYDLKASCVIRMMNLMKYDAAAAARNEMFKGIPRALAMSGKAKFPVISASIADKTKQNPVFKPYVTRKISGATITITGVCDSSCFVTGNSMEYDYTTLPVSDTLSGILNAISPESDFIVVLSQMAPDSNIALLRDFPSVDIIIESYGNKKYEPPVTTPNGIIVSPGHSGRFVGLITIEKSDGKVKIKRSEMIPVLNIPEDRKAHKIVVEYYHKRK